MRILRFATAVMLTVSALPASAAPDLCGAGPTPRVLAAPGNRPQAAACMVPHAGLRAAAQLAQYGGPYGVGGCRPGQSTCINGWIAVCQCYSYGCNYMATANRC